MTRLPHEKERYRAKEVDLGSKELNPVVCSSLPRFALSPRIRYYYKWISTLMVRVLIYVPQDEGAKTRLNQGGFGKWR